MTKAEFADIAAAMRTYYPREQLLPNDQAMTRWYEMLEEYNAAAVEKALKHWVRTNKYSPSIAELRDLAQGVADGRILDLDEVQQMRRARNQNKYDVRYGEDSLTITEV